MVIIVRKLVFLLSKLQISQTHWDTAIQCCLNPVLCTC